MRNKLVAIFLFIALISSSFSRFYVYAGFELNRSFIAEKLCENKARPWMHCNGKCYFMKKIKQAAENEKKQEGKDNLSRLEISFFQEAFSLALNQPTELVVPLLPVPTYDYFYTSQHIDAIFRPPKLIA